MCWSLILQGFALSFANREEILLRSVAVVLPWLNAGCTCKDSAPLCVFERYRAVTDRRVSQRREKAATDCCPYWENKYSKRQESSTGLKPSWGHGQWGIRVYITKKSCRISRVLNHVWQISICQERFVVELIWLLKQNDGLSTPSWLWRFSQDSRIVV